MQQNITVYNPDIITTVPTLVYHNYNFTTTTTVTNSNYDVTSFYNDYGYGYSYIPSNINYTHSNPINLNLELVINSIPMVADRIIPRESVDIITYEDINSGDILINFRRDTKTENEYGAYYKESTLETIIKSKRNQFTMELLDITSFVKYRCIIE